MASRPRIMYAATTDDGIISEIACWTPCSGVPTHRSRDGNPLQEAIELEWKDHNINPRDLGDGNTISGGERSV